MRAVLDDNCTLCLPNGERIKLNPLTMRMVSHIAAALLHGTCFADDAVAILHQTCLQCLWLVCPAHECQYNMVMLAVFYLCSGV